MLEIMKECTGCMACVNSCPALAIRITEDEYGFLMPVVDTESCINCGLCERVCPIEIRGEDGEKTAPMEAWAMYHNNEEIVRISSSGGVYYALAKAVTDRGGIAFGCFYDIKKKEARLEDTDNLPLTALLTSKYVESRIGEEGLKRVKKQAETGREVIFCGTPCQAAGLKTYRGKEYDNLLITDFACGGVAAQPYLRDYLKALEDRYGSPVKKMSFRDKHYGWGQYCFYTEFENGEVYRKTAMSDPYFFCFLRSSMQRLSCHGCLFSDDHKSDICLSDFWRCDFFDVDRNDRKGISLALIYSEKGRQKIRELSDVMHMESLPIEGASYHLKGRTCPETKLPEIFRDMSTAKNEGVEALRDKLLTDEEKKFYDRRQEIMDDPELRRSHPEIVGNGQIVQKP